MKFILTCGTLNALTFLVVLLAALVRARLALLLVSSAPNIAGYEPRDRVKRTKIEQKNSQIERTKIC